MSAMVVAAIMESKKGRRISSEVLQKRQKRGKNHSHCKSFQKGTKRTVIVGVMVNA